MFVCEQEQVFVRARGAAASDGRTTEPVNMSINLNDEIRKNLGVVDIGGVKHFTLNVQVLTGYEMGPLDRSSGSNLTVYEPWLINCGKSYANQNMGEC